MSRIRLYLDADAQDHDLVAALRLRGVDVETANEAGRPNDSDLAQLTHAVTNGRTLYSFNISDFMALHAAYINEGREHAGIILAPQQRYGIGEQMRRLLKISSVKSSETMRNKVEFLSAWN